MVSGSLGSAANAGWATNVTAATTPPMAAWRNLMGRLLWSAWWPVRPVAHAAAGVLADDVSTRPHAPCTRAFRRHEPVFTPIGRGENRMPRGEPCPSGQETASVHHFSRTT